MLVVAFGNQHFHGPPKKLFPLVPKEFLGLGIDQRDFAMLIGDDHGIRSRFQESAELIVGPQLPGGVTQSCGATPFQHDDWPRP
jgi:hypothetical protein